MDKYIGIKINMLQVLSIDNEKTLLKNRRYYKCLCDCGNEKSINIDSLRTGSTKSCGCYRVKRMIGHKFKNTHNMNNTRIYHIWSRLKQRCKGLNAKDKKNYTSRHISYDPRWEKFENFYNDMKNGYKDNLSIDRIDNSKGYSKENCRWATEIEQQNNRTNNIIFFYKGERMTMKQISDKLGIKYRRIRTYKDKGMTIEEIIKKISN